MGSSPPAPTEMAAAQALVTVLWAASLSSCAAQGLNQNQLVSDVVVALQPSIARAVADALAGLNSRSVSTSSIGSSSTGSRGSISTASRGSLSSVTSSRSSSTGASERGIATAGPTARPVYNFQYKVADDGEQSYISQEEARDGDNLSGTYSYVDANGALVTVNYESGAMGYSETRDLQEGFVQMRARPVWTGALAVDNSAAVTAAKDQAAQAAQATQAAQSAQAAKAAQAAQAARRAESVRLAAARQESARLEAARREAATLEASRLTASQQSSLINQNSIISQVISSLQPLISRTVQGVI